MSFSADVSGSDREFVEFTDLLELTGIDLSTKNKNFTVKIFGGFQVLKAE